MKLVLGTKNPGKLREFHELAEDTAELELLLAPPEFDPEETGQTFAENALIKAKEAARLTNCLALGEDSGISVDALNGEPGIYSARYCPGSDQDRMHKLLESVNRVSTANRKAAYHCAIALVSANGDVLHTVQATWSGEIAKEPLGANGFGYDPIFLLPDLQKTAAQLIPQEKNAISHRAQAFREMLKLVKMLGRKDQAAQGLLP
jgi:XTP/dITP diphosphohydrolase